MGYAILHEIHMKPRLCVSSTPKILPPEMNFLAWTEWKIIHVIVLVSDIVYQRKKGYIYSFNVNSEMFVDNSRVITALSTKLTALHVLLWASCPTLTISIIFTKAKLLKTKRIRTTFIFSFSWNLYIQQFKL